MFARRIHLSDRKPIRQYLELPFHLSRNDPNWFPGLRSMTLTDMQPSHPYYSHSSAAFFLALDGDRTLGRIAVLMNNRFNQHQHTRTAFFTHFACADNPDAAKILMHSAEGWAREHGAENMMGPIGFLQTDARGLMVGGFGELTSFASPYHPPCYATLLSSAGYEKKADYLCGVGSPEFEISRRTDKMADRVLNRSNVQLKIGSAKRELKQLGRQFLEVYKAAGKASPFYYPPTNGEEDLILDRLEKSANPKLMQWLEKDGRIIAVQMAQPNYLQALRRAPENRIARSLACIRQRRRPVEANISTTFIHPDYQGRGFNLVLYRACQQAARAAGTEYGLIGPVLETNTGKIRVLEKTGFQFTIRHRVFVKEIK
jgi:GNAT superfamily N-acetyltransferase